MAPKASRFRGLGVIVLSCLAAATGASGQVIFNVDSPLDQLDDDTADGVCHTAANTCTLRAAVMQANKIGGGGATIVLPPGVYNLTRPAIPPYGDDDGDLDLLSPLSGSPPIAIFGAGPNSTIIDANQVGRIFFVASGRIASLAGVTLRNGLAFLSDGGGIDNEGNLTVRQSRLTGNDAPNGYGGAIQNFGSLVLRQSTLAGNSAESGGGISNDASGTLEMSECTLSGNSAIYGGGMYSNAGDTYVMNSSIVDNNSVDFAGGVYASVDSQFRFYSCTIVGNQADSDVDLNGVCGGVCNSGGLLNLVNSVVAGNYVSGSPVYDDCFGPIGSYGQNRFGTMPALCTVTQVGAGSSSLLGSLSELGALRSNGGNTETVAIVGPSSLIDGAEPTLGCPGRQGDPLLTDQRGGPRTAGAFCDIGAFELGALPVGVIFSDGFEAGNSWAW